MDQPIERSAFALFSTRVAAGLIDWLIVFAALWLAFPAFGLPLVAGFADAHASRAVAIFTVGLSFTALALIGHLWALRDPRRQSLQDRLFGLAVVNAKPQEESTLATPVST